MLDLLRGFAKGWVAKILIALLVISFAIWGVSGSLIFGNISTVAQVGKTEVNRFDFAFAYQNQLRALQQQFRRPLTQEQADAIGLRQTVLAQVISGAVLDENSRKMGLGLSDQNVALEIAKDERFFDLSGNFSRSQLRAALGQLGISENDYIADRKKVALRNQLQEGTSSALDMPKAFSDALSVYEKEQRVFDYVIVGDEVIAEQPVPTDDLTKKYYEANLNNYRAPEYRKVTILKLEASDVMKPQEVTNEDLQAAYENRKSSLATPERRRVEQLVLASNDEAQQVKDKLNSGTSFEDVLKELGKTVADVDLGLMLPSDLPDEAVSKAAFEAKLNEPTDIIPGTFGPIILRISEIQEASTTPFDEVKDELRNFLAIQRATDEVFALFDVVEDERSAGVRLAEAAERAELKARVITAMDARGQDENGNNIANIPNLNQLAQAAFIAEPDEDTQALEIGASGFLWYEVDEITPERQKTFEEVKSDAQTDWVNAEKANKIREVAEKIAERVRIGEDFNTVLAEVIPDDSFGNKTTFVKSEPVTRTGQISELGAEPLQVGYATAEGDIATARSPNNTYAVVRVAEVVDPTSLELTEDQTNRLNETAAIDMLNQVVADLQSRETVTVNQQAIEAALNPHNYGGGQHGF